LFSRRPTVMLFIASLKRSLQRRKKRDKSVGKLDHLRISAEGGRVLKLKLPEASRDEGSRRKHMSEERRTEVSLINRLWDLRQVRSGRGEGVSSTH